MKIIVDYPPNIESVDATFQCKNKDVIYAFGDTIFNPKGLSIPDFLIEHERVHGARQGVNVEEWWNRYLSDVKFRYIEELQAHTMEYQVRCSGVKDRNQKTQLLMWSARRLCSPLYGKMASVNQAMKDIQGCVLSLNPVI